MKSTTQKPIPETEATLIAIQEKLDGWASLCEEVPLPSDLAAALMTGRPELVALCKPRDMTAAEVAPLLNLIRVLLKTNRLLQEHAQAVSEMAFDARRLLQGTVTKLFRLGDYASFNSPIEENSDEEA